MRALDRGQRELAWTIEARQRPQQAKRVRVERVRQHRFGGTRLDDLARVHDREPIDEAGDDAKVMRDEQERHVQFVAQALQQLEDLRLDRDVEGGGGLVRDQERWLAGQCHGDHRALPHAARELVRVVVDAPLRARDADHAEQVDGALPGGGVPHVPVSLEALGDLAADGQDRVQARQRILEDHGDARRGSCASHRSGSVRRSLPWNMAVPRR